MKDWRKELADQIRAAADSIYKEADRLADQPDYMVSEAPAWVLTLLERVVKADTEKEGGKD